MNYSPYGESGTVSGDYTIEGRTSGTLGLYDSYDNLIVWTYTITGSTLVSVQFSPATPVQFSAAIDIYIGTKLPLTSIVLS